MGAHTNEVRRERSGGGAKYELECVFSVELESGQLGGGVGCGGGYCG